MRTIVVATVVVATVAAVIAAGCEKPQPAVTLYEKAEVTRGTLEVSVGSSGIVEPLATVEVKSKASGEVLELLVDTGDYVGEGALMVRIDPRTVRNRLSQAEAERKAADARRDIWRTQLERARTLVARGTLTQTDYEQAALELANAEAQVVAARVEVENAGIAVDDTEIRAPIAGTVISKPVEKGQVISSPTQDFAGGTLLLTMADLAAVQIRTMVDETDIGKIQPGMPARVVVAAYPNQPFNGEVVKIEPQAILEQNVTMFAVLVSIRNPDGLLKPGMNAEVDISVARSEDVLTVPVMALRTRRDLPTTAQLIGIDEDELKDRLGENERPAIGPPAGDRPAPEHPAGDYRFGGRFWVVVDDGGRLRPAGVQTGITDLERVEIVAGLQEAERVLILPSAHLVETQQQLQEFVNRRAGGVPGIGR
jgi:HlyD family secretion protein